MSLHNVAKHLAAHGRNSDTTLVHMTPGEVASLQSLAQQHGGSLTTNPHTGLPEAGFLSALLPMAAGAGLAAMGMPAGYAALSVGAASAMTNGGDLRKGLMNGISAYGGAGMAESFMGAGLGTMGGAMGAPAAGAAPTTVLETPAGATSPYALTGSTAAPSTAGYSLGESSSYVNQPLPTLASAAPAQVAQQAAAMTPAAQAAQQSAALNELSMGQRWDALKAGATGTNAMNYIKANPLTSLGIAAFAMTPDEKNVAQKAPDTDRGPRANMQYHPGWSTPTPRPNMFGVEQTYNRPYYAAEGGITHMATGGITSAPRNQQQLFADYLSRVSSSGAAGNTTPPNNYDWWKNPNDPTPATPAAAPTETPEEYAARMRANARGGSGSMTAEQRAEIAADNAKPQPMLNGLSRDQYFGGLGLSPEEQNAVRAQADKDNPKTAALINAVKFAASPVKFMYDKLAPPAPPSLRQKTIDAADAESRAVAQGGVKFGLPATTPVETTPYSPSELAGAEMRDAEGRNPANFNDAPASAAEAQTNAALSVAPYTRSLAEGNTPYATYGPVAQSILSNLKKQSEIINSWPRTALQTPVTVAPSDTFSSAPEAVAGATAQPSSRLTTTSLTPTNALGNFTFGADAAKEYGAKENNTFKNQISALIQQQEAVAKDYVKSAETLGLQHPTTQEYKTEADRLNDQINAAYNQVLGQEANAALTPAANAQQVRPSDMGAVSMLGRSSIPDTPGTNTWGGLYSGVGTALNPFPGAFNYGKEAAATKNVGAYTPGQFKGAYLPDIKGVNEISADTDNTDNTDNTEDTGLSQLTTPYSPASDVAAFAPNQVAALTPGIPAPDMGIRSNSGLAGIPGAGGLYGGPGWGGVGVGFGGLGSSWQGVTDRDGNPVMTSQGEAEKAFRESPEGLAMQKADMNADRESQNGGNQVQFSGITHDSETPATGMADHDPGGDARGGYLQHGRFDQRMARGGNVHGAMRPPPAFFQNGKYSFHPPQMYADGGELDPYNLGSYSDGGRLLKGPGDGVSDSIPATIGKGRPARLADGEFVVPARIVSEIGNGSTEAGARKLYAMMDRIQAGRKKSIGKGKVAVNSRADKYLPA